MDILEELSAARRADAHEREKATPYREVLRRIAAAPAAKDFAAAFRGKGLHVISELKKASPSEAFPRVVLHWL